MECIQPSVDVSFRQASPSELMRALQDARDYTLTLFDRFRDAGLDAAERVPRLAIVNPPRWELGHVAWFAEWYILREAQSSHPAAAKGASLLDGADRWFDSSAVAHDARWTLDLPEAGALKAYCRDVLGRVLNKLTHTPHLDAALYPFRLALAHEDMHGEAFAYTLQTLEVVAPPLPQWQAPQAAAQSFPRGEIHFDGGSFLLGSPPDGGYGDAGLWTPAGQDWLRRQGRAAPQGWQREGGQWLARRFGRVAELAPQEAVRHVSLHEAQAYCAWRKRRLLGEAEWEYAAQSGHPSLQWGDLWEWTGSPFKPYPGFAADAYREYSAPWFGTHQVLRGASFATPPRMRSAKYRNFYLPGRADMFVGFRTCALQD